MYSNYGPGALLEKETRLYDLHVDAGQTEPLDNAVVEDRMIELLTGLMEANEAPAEAFTRLGLAFRTR
jgi:hypothetical protein